MKKLETMQRLVGVDREQVLDVNHAWRILLTFAVHLDQCIPPGEGEQTAESFDVLEDACRKRTKQQFGRSRQVFVLFR